MRRRVTAIRKRCRDVFTTRIGQRGCRTPFEIDHCDATINVRRISLEDCLPARLRNRPITLARIPVGIARESRRPASCLRFIRAIRDSGIVDFPACIRAGIDRQLSGAGVDGLGAADEHEPENERKVFHDVFLTRQKKRSEFINPDFRECKGQKTWPRLCINPGP